MNLINGDCRDIFPAIPPLTVDAVVTDPPYGLSFMGKDWDHGIPGVEFWKAAYRVMKPGAFLLSFGGTRTFHRLTCAIEDAGFEIRDCMMWLYGSGFPKSHDVSKAIDKAAGAKRENGALKFKGGTQLGVINDDAWKPKDVYETAPSTDSARQWSGWGTALKPAWEPIIVARKPIEGTVAENVLKWGTGAMNIDGSRISANLDEMKGRSGTSAIPGGDTTSYQAHNSNGGVWEPNNQGRWPANVILDEEAGEMLDEQTQGVIHAAGSKRFGGLAIPSNPNSMFFGEGVDPANGMRYGDSGGASRFFYCAKASKRERNAGLEGMPELDYQTGCGGDFPTDDQGRNRDRFKSKAQNTHPTVKPLALMSYLIKLVCPPGGTVLDPFLGSGSTGVAAAELGFDFIGIEKEPHYAEIATKRMSSFQQAGQ